MFNSTIELYPVGALNPIASLSNISPTTYSLILSNVPNESFQFSIVQEIYAFLVSPGLIIYAVSEIAGESKPPPLEKKPQSCVFFSPDGVL